MRGVFSEMGNRGFPPEVVEAIKDGVDCNLYFFGSKVPLSNMYIIPTGSRHRRRRDRRKRLLLARIAAISTFWRLSMRNSPKMVELRYALC